MPAKDYFLPEFKPFLTSVPSTCLCLLLEEGTKSIPGTITLENTWLSCKNPAQRQSSQTTHIRHQRLGLMQLPSGKRLHNYGKSPFLMGKLTISMAILNSYVTLPEGITYTDLLQVFPSSHSEKNEAHQSRKRSCSCLAWKRINSACQSDVPPLVDWKPAELWKYLYINN